MCDRGSVQKVGKTLSQKGLNFTPNITNWMENEQSILTTVLVKFCSGIYAYTKHLTIKDLFTFFVTNNVHFPSYTSLSTVTSWRGFGDSENQ